jgi:hypothetical protein
MTAYTYLDGAVGSTVGRGMLSAFTRVSRSERVAGMDSSFDYLAYAVTAAGMDSSCTGYRYGEVRTYEEVVEARRNLVELLYSEKVGYMTAEGFEEFRRELSRRFEAR